MLIAHDNISGDAIAHNANLLWCRSFEMQHYVWHHSRFLPQVTNELYHKFFFAQQCLRAIRVITRAASRVTYYGEALLAKQRLSKV